MPEPLKNVYTYTSLRTVAVDLHAVYNAFAIDEFLCAVFNEAWDTLELKARIHHISVALRQFLPTDYGIALSIIDQVVMNHAQGSLGFGLFFPTFVELYGQNEEHWDLSMRALRRYTPHASAEFAVRVFIIKNPERMMAQMMAWANDPDEHVRRLASEGCRPALPWGQALTCFKKDPTPLLPLLHQLKADPSPYVRKSVANNLNDISKTHPDLVLNLSKKWYGKEARTDWIVKHANRTLLKKGHPEALALFGFNSHGGVVSDFGLNQSILALGKAVTFSFSVTAPVSAKVRLEYGVEYVKSSGKHSRKIFQISEITLKAGETRVYTKKHSFMDLSTRKHYAGTHTLTLIVNGVEQERAEFELHV